MYNLHDMSYLEDLNQYLGKKKGLILAAKEENPIKRNPIKNKEGFKGNVVPFRRCKQCTLPPSSAQW